MNLVGKLGDRVGGFGKLDMAAPPRLLGCCDTQLTGNLASFGDADSSRAQQFDQIATSRGIAPCAGSAVPALPGRFASDDYFPSGGPDPLRGRNRPGGGVQARTAPESWSRSAMSVSGRRSALGWLAPGRGRGRRQPRRLPAV